MVSQGLTKQRLDNFVFGGMDAVQRDMDRFIERFLPAAGRFAFARAWDAPVSIWEDDEHLYVELDMPGVKAEDIDATVEKGVLRVAFERKAPERKYWHQERAFGRMERELSVPDTINPDNIEATLQEGVLTLRLQKRPESLPRRIDVKSR